MQLTQGFINWTLTSIFLFANFRYIQSAYIRMKAEEAKKKAQIESERQIMRAFFATEELRLEVTCTDRDKDKQIF